jgi:TonB family protein
MFTMLSPESVSETPRRGALYASCTIHICAFIALTWFSIFHVSAVRFEVLTVQAGSREPVRKPEPFYIPVRNSPGILPERTKPMSPATEMVNQTESNDNGGWTPTPIPPGFLALLETETVPVPAVVMGLYATRTMAPLTPSEPSVPAPEPPPGEPDIKPPPIIGGHLEPAQLIDRTVPTYPILARNARVEGVVLIEGTVNVSGRVENIHVVDGHPLLVDAAIRAVKKWKYRPAILNGQPTPCPVTITVRFNLKYPGE